MRLTKDYFKQFKTPKYEKTNIFKRFFIRQFIAKIEKSFLTINPQTILELGCGEGFACGWLKTNYPDTEITGVDINQNDLKKLKQLFPTINTKCLDLHNIANSDISQKHFNLLLSLETLEHLQDPETFLAQLTKLNWDNLVISVPWEPYFQLLNFARGYNWKNWGDNPEHINHWNNRQFTKLLSKHFNIHKNKISFPWQIIWLKK